MAVAANATPQLPTESPWTDVVLHSDDLRLSTGSSGSGRSGLFGPDLEMLSDPLVRRARLDEGLYIASVWLDARGASSAIPAPVHSDDDVRRWFVEEVLPTQEVWVAEVDGFVVGLLAFDAGWVTQLYVDPTRQRQGLGSALLEQAKQRSPEGLDLWTFETNVASHRFYERHGFVVVESTDGRDNEEQVPDRRYRWQRSEWRAFQGASRG